MTNKALSIFNQLRPLSVGFDDVFDHFESMFDYDTVNVSNYPPYNIVKTGGNKFDIEVALAGFTIADDVEINGAELKDGMLRVSMEKIVPEAKKLKTIEIK
jgi:molecular chaperone IbpA